MTTSSVTYSVRAVAIGALLLLSWVPQACTNLDETPSSAITPGNFYRNQAEVLAGLAGVYSELKNTTWGYYNLSEISSDELIVPTRGSDWYDNGRWLEIHRQLWGASSPSGLEDLNGAWSDAYTGVARATALLEAMQKVSVPGQATIVAEARTLRAYYYYQLMDLFGGVPIVTVNDYKPHARATRAELFQFIVSELTAARADLPATWDDANRGRMTKGATAAVLANMYLNAAVFTKDVGINATGYNSCLTVPVGGGTACDAALAWVDSVLNSGLYQLEDSFPKAFRATNHASKENIFVVKSLASDGLGLNFVMRALHYNQFTPAPWNGFATAADVYNAFDAADARRGIFLIGQQYDLSAGTPGDSVKDRQGNWLVFTDTIGDATAARENEGPRLLKWPPDSKHVGPDNGNDFAYFRLGEIYLIKAEAEFENGNSAQAIIDLNYLRARDFNPDQNLIAVDHTVLLNERMFELTGEAKRRQDLIRFGLYTAARPIDDIAAHNLPVRDPTRVLMAIPQTQMDANPLLKQNAGY